MSGYVSCPACHGRGLIPMEEAGRIEVHAITEAEARVTARREREAANVRSARR